MYQFSICGLQVKIVLLPGTLQDAEVSGTKTIFLNYTATCLSVTVDRVLDWRLESLTTLTHAS
jgi:hypothetical protein